MKFQPDTAEGVNLITRHEPAAVWVGGRRFGHSLLVPWSGTVQPWAASRLDELTPAHFEQIAALRPEVVILGTGARLSFAAPALTRSLIGLRIGVETMDTPAACRTYNVLASEGRRVLAALLLAPPSADRSDQPETL